MGNPDLKELSRQYAEGELNAYEYRQKRTEIINEITGDQVPAAAALPTGNSPPSTVNGLNAAIKIAVLALVLIAVIVIVYINSKDSNDKVTEKSSVSAKRMLATNSLPELSPKNT